MRNITRTLTATGRERDTAVDHPNARWIIDTERRWETLQFDSIDCSRP